MNHFTPFLLSMGLFKHYLTSIYQRSKLNLKLNFETQSYKPKNKKVIETIQNAWREPYFFTFRSHQWCKKSVQKEKLQFREQNVWARQTSFSVIFLFNKTTTPIFQIIHMRNKPTTLASTEVLKEVLNKGARSKLVSRVFLLFGINVKERRSPENLVAEGLNWTKESQDNGRARINSALIVSTLCFNIGSFCTIIR